MQSWYSAASPTQGKPPLRGSGLVQVLLRTRKPSSQSREQDDHGPQVAQPPFRVCGDVLPLRRRSSTRAAEGLGLSDPDLGLSLRPRPPGLPPSPPLLAVPSVSQAPVPSAGQVLVSVLLLPNCRPCGSGSGARQVKRNRCSWRAPPWVTFTGSQGVQGVLRRTSGQASGLQVLNSFGVRVASDPPNPAWTVGLPAPRAPAPRPHHAATRARVAILARTASRLHAASTVVAALAPGTPGSPEDGHWARCIFITEPGEKGGVSP